MPEDISTPEPTLRLATIDNLDAILAVHIASREAAYRGRLPDDAMDRESVDERRSRWHGRLTGDDPRALTLVAEIDGRIAGFCRSGPDTSDSTGQTGQVKLIYVAPDAQGHGLGRALLERTTAMIAADGFSRATLGVYVFNAKAIRFYEHLGWVRFDTTEMPGPSGTPITSYLYEKDLAPMSDQVSARDRCLKATLPD